MVLGGMIYIWHVMAIGFGIQAVLRLLSKQPERL
jgi:hypothetical protein